MLAGALPDQAALHGVLAQIEALGLELVEVRPLEALTVTPRAAITPRTAGQAWSVAAQPKTEGIWSDRTTPARPGGQRRSTRASRTIATSGKGAAESVGNKILVSVFDSERTAFEGLTALKDLHGEGDITLYASTVIAKDAWGPCRSARRRIAGRSARSWASSPVASSGCSGARQASRWAHTSAASAG